MAKYANKTCYDCGIILPANQMEKVTESYNSGRSDRRPDGVNVAAFLLSDAKTSRNMIKGATTKNNRRVYTRNRTAWKCLDCSGHNDAIRAAEARTLDAELKAKQKAQRAEQKALAATQPLSTFAFLCNAFLAFLGVLFLWAFYQTVLNGTNQPSQAIFGALLLCTRPLVWRSATSSSVSTTASRGHRNDYHGRRYKGDH